MDNSQEFSIVNSVIDIPASAPNSISTLEDEIPKDSSDNPNSSTDVDRRQTTLRSPRISSKHVHFQYNSCPKKWTILQSAFIQNNQSMGNITKHLKTWHEEVYEKNNSNSIIKEF